MNLSKKRRALYVASALALAVGLASVPRMQAQTDAPDAASTMAACQLPPGAPPPLSLPDTSQVGQKLASALNLPLATVQQAMTSIGAQSSQLLPAPRDPIAGAASQLGVPEQQLVAAVQAADQAVGPMFATSGGPGGGNVTFGPVSGPPPGGAGQIAGQIMIACADGGKPAQPDPSTFFADVAQQLGSSFTAGQVQSAFQASAPTPPDPTTFKSIIQQQTNSLAAALGVSAQALANALSSVGLQSGCLPLFGEAKPASQPPGSDGKPIFIPLGGGPGGPGAVAFSGGPAGGSVSAPAGAGGDVAIACAIGPGPGPSGQTTDQGS